MAPVIERAQIHDLDTLVQFQLRMALETENLRLNSQVVIEGVREVLHNSHRGQYWLAKLHGQVVASMLVLIEWSDWRNGEVLWIHSVFVVPEFRGQGVFKAMYGFLKNRVLENHQLKGLRLYVEQKNHLAQEVYRSLGMSADHYSLFEWMK